MAGSIDKLIINSPHQEPEQHWFYDRENRNFYIKEGRRPAGYVMATPNSKAFDDPGIFVEIDIVNKSDQEYMLGEKQVIQELQELPNAF